MVLTVEPGIYLENWGGVRVEEDILVTEDGCEILTHLPNGLEVLEVGSNTEYLKRNCPRGSIGLCNHGPDNP